MPYPISLLIHQCTLIKQHAARHPDITQELNQDSLNQAQTPVQDTYGNPIIQATALGERRCRFGTHMANLGNSGYYSTTTCTLQATTDISENDLVITDTPGYAKAYWVNAVRQIYEATGNRISHTILDLREVEEGV